MDKIAARTVFLKATALGSSTVIARQGKKFARMDGPETRVNRRRHWVTNVIKVNI